MIDSKLKIRINTASYGNTFVICENLDQCRRAWVEVRDYCGGYQPGIGASDMRAGCGDVFYNGKLAYKISYNGRAWDLAGNAIEPDQLTSITTPTK